MTITLDKNLTFRHHISEVSSDILKEFELPEDYGGETKEAVNPRQVRDLLIARVFNLRLNWIAQKHPESRKLAAEKVVAALMKHGIGKDKIRFSRDSFIVNLPNMEYCILKAESGCYVRTGNSQIITCIQRNSPKDIAKLIMNFDNEVPELERHSRLLFDAIQEQQIQQRQAAMVKELSESILRPLVEQYLKPLGISVQYCFDDDCANVSLDLRKVF